MKEAFKEKLIGFREKVVECLQGLDPKARPRHDQWDHRENGGGVTTVLSGEVFERAAVAFSDVQGTLSADIAKQMGAVSDVEIGFEAFGTSLIIHPRSPRVPTVHANVRYLEVQGKKWIGGGTDLTPYVFAADDARHFHQHLASTCDRFDKSYYPRFKKWCDEYFYLPHRGETRGVGGIFFDYLGRDDGEVNRYFDFASAIADVFPEAYFPIVKRRMGEQSTEAEKKFQMVRRGRYVEFNLLYDRGTLFGLKSGGRVESILMSMPPSVNWEYNFEPEPGTNAAELMEILRKPREWI